MLMQQLGFGSMKPTTIFCDNKGAITMGLQPSNKLASRHINMRKHFCRQNVELGNVTIPYKKTTDMLADFLSKQTPKPTHERHRNHAFGASAESGPSSKVANRQIAPSPVGWEGCSFVRRGCGARAREFF